MIVGGTIPEAPSQTGTNCDNGAEKTYVVHEAIVRAESPFFEAALSKEWQESKERIVRLPKQYPEAFDVYIGWVYSGKIIIGKYDIVKKEEDRKAAIELSSALSRAMFSEMYCKIWTSKTQLLTLFWRVS